MKKLLALGIGIVALSAFAGLARAADTPTKHEGRIWVDTNMLLVFSPNWSLTTMPGGRVEYAKSREASAGVQFLEFFFGPNYTYRTGNWTIKGSLWYYYMGYPSRGRTNEAGNCLVPPIGATTYCASTYNFSHNLEVIPSVEYRWGRWSLYDRVIFHNTFYADYYSSPYYAPGLDPNSNLPPTLSVSDQRWGWGTVIRELLQLRYAVTDRAGVFVSDEIFLGVIEDGDTSGMRKRNADGSLAQSGYHPIGYWKQGFRYNRSYIGFDYKVTPNLTVAPSYMMEIALDKLDSTDVTDIAHTFFMVATISAATFDPPKK